MRMWQRLANDIAISFLDIPVPAVLGKLAVLQKCWRQVLLGEPALWKVQLQEVRHVQLEGLPTDSLLSAPAEVRAA
jgi:hypothetical protein